MWSGIGRLWKWRPKLCPLLVEKIKMHLFYPHLQHMFITITDTSDWSLCSVPEIEMVSINPHRPPQFDCQCDNSSRSKNMDYCWPLKKRFMKPPLLSILSFVLSLILRSWNEERQDGSSRSELRSYVKAPFRLRAEAGKSLGIGCSSVNGRLWLSG